MGCPLYLAMTAAEFYAASPLPSHPAWMACHFSPYGQGLSNFPQRFLEDEMLILNDRIPVADHSADRISGELRELVEQFRIDRLLLDLQRPGNDQTKQIVKHIASTLPCSIGISHHYALAGCPVFVPPGAIDTSMEQYLYRWKGYEIWIEMTTEPLCLEINHSGCTEANWDITSDKPEHWDDNLCCHYRISTTTDRAQFLLYRTPEDIQKFADSLSPLGVVCGVGLYQEFNKKKTALHL